MHYSSESFKNYIKDKQNRSWLVSALIISIVSFTVLRSLFPIPSYYADSFTWVGAARTGQPVTFRPVGYSKLMMFFKFFSTSDFALITAQYLSNVAANLFLFFTFTYFFTLKRRFKFLLYLLLIVNPFYVFYSNYISSDPFFTCLSVFWFTLLIWILNKPTWPLIITQLIVLACLFELRYNAIFFPAISTIALLLAKQSRMKKVVGIASSFVLVWIIVLVTTYVNNKYIGTNTFSAFSGWQLANDALHIVHHEKVDTNNIKDKEVKALLVYTNHFFDTSKQYVPDSGATAFFMWYFNSPLKKYMAVYPGRGKSYFKTWNELGPLYNNFGKTIILQHPVSYLRHFVLPNARAYILPPLETYKTYMEDVDTIAAVAQKYYHYSSNKTPAHHPVVYAIVFLPMQYLFVVVNVVFLLLGLFYLVKRHYKKQPVLYNQILLCFTAFYLANFFFIVLLAPSVLRYHIFILTLSFPILLYLVQQLFARR